MREDQEAILAAGIPIQRAVGLGVDSVGQVRPIAFDASGAMLTTHTPSGSSSGVPAWAGVAVLVMGILPDGSMKPLQVDKDGKVVIT